MNHVRGTCVILMIFGIVNCIGGQAQKETINYYTLAYDAPEPVNQNRIPAVIRVPRFQVDPPYNSHRMIYTNQAFQRNAYHYHQWRANPGDLVPAFLARDLRQASLVSAVFVYDGVVPATHVLEGVVEEFYENDDPIGWYAILSVSLTLIKIDAVDVSERIRFQRRYHSKKKCLRKNPEALAQAMSQAMAEISAFVITDVRNALLEDR